MSTAFVLPFLWVSSFAGILSAQGTFKAVLPNGREIRPQGTWMPVAPYPFAVAVRGDSAEAVVPSIGFPFALNVVAGPFSAKPMVTQIPNGAKSDEAVEVDAGVAYAPDGHLLYVSTGDSGKVRAYRSADWKVEREASLDGELRGEAYTGSFAGPLILSPDGKRIFVLDEGNWRVVVLDAATLHVMGAAPTGAYPFGLALSPDGRRLYVTNTGLFAYATIPGAKKDDAMGTGLRFPPFGYPSKEAREGTMAEGKAIPGLGDENSTRGSSLWTYDVREPGAPAVTAKLRLGSAIQESGSGAVGGAAPTGVSADGEAVYVSLAHQDAVVKVSAGGERVEAQAALSPFAGARFQDAGGIPLRGVMPSGVEVRDDRVYVAESGINAVAVLDAKTLHVLEHIPVGWNPTAVHVWEDGSKLLVVNTKGKGTGPNAGARHDEKSPTYIGSLELGSLSVIALDGLPDPDTLTRSVVEANLAAIAAQPAMPRLKHCFLVIRENRTYDEVLGDVSGANGDASLARYGMRGWAEEARTATQLRVTPNLHALVRRFAMSDNFYVDSDVSADGHRWVLGIQPTPFFNTAWTSNYGGRRKGDAFAAQPGRRALFGGADAPMPEDQPEFGSLWEHVARGSRASGGILNYGEGLELEGNEEIAGSEPEGQRLMLNAPVPEPVFQSSDRSYPTFNLGIPDQFRASEFERDFTKRLRAGTVPALIVIRLPGDHTADPRPRDGYPYRASYVADNDLALGRIVAFLSKTSIWKDSAMFVTEDDAQGGVDHVDAHRSVLAVVSPFARPGAVSHQHSSMGSIIRTMNELLGLEPMNLEDALAGPIGGIFETTPHMEPFQRVAADPRVFAPAKARFARPKTKKEEEDLRDIDDVDVIRREMEKSKKDLRRKQP